MKTIITYITLLIFILLTGCSMLDENQKDAEIIKLNIDLKNQQGARAADNELAEKQVAYYLGCKLIINRCSKETINLGEKLLKNGFTGEVTIWFLIGLLWNFIFIAATSLSFVYFASGIYFYSIEPNKKEISHAKYLVSEIEKYITEEDLYRNAHEKEMKKQREEYFIISEEIKEKKEKYSEICLEIIDATSELSFLKNEITDLNKLNLNKRIDDY